jgi:hypothetical protein
MGSKPACTRPNPHQGKTKEARNPSGGCSSQTAMSQTSASSAAIASSLQEEFGVGVHPSTVRRTLKQKSVVCGYAKHTPMLSNTNLMKRVKWCKKKERGRSSFAGTMFTDSKIFLLNTVSSKRGPQIYYPKGDKPKVPSLKHSKGVHVYLGATKFGLTKPIFVTGGGSRVSKYKSTKTKAVLRGVGGEEYRADVLVELVPEGNRLFSKSGYWKERWIIQQDNAPAHSARETKEEIVRLMGGDKSRVELDWPPMSPDLSWIENVWGLAERELAKERQSIKTISELEKSVEKILKGIRIEVLENLVKSMPARLRKVIEGGGHPIDF